MSPTLLPLTLLGIDELERPVLFWLALAAGAAALLWAWRHPPASIAWPAQREALAAGATRLDALAVLHPVLRAGALVALATILAGPVGVQRAAPEPGFGLDLVLVVDASDSMRALDARDARAAGGWRTRLDLAREVVARFAERRAAAGDRVALIVFGESAFTQCPLTSDGRLLASALERVEAGMAGKATALGDALALAVKRGTLPGAADVPSAGRVAVLLSDGRSNAGAVSVEVATALARARGLRTHTVAIGSAGEEVAMRSPGRAAEGMRFERHDVDTATLKRIAEETGGLFFRARRSADLEAVYAEIDAVERLERRLPHRMRRTQRPEPLLALAGGLLLTELGLVRVARRRLP